MTHIYCTNLNKYIIQNLKETVNNIQSWQNSWQNPKPFPYLSQIKITIFPTNFNHIFVISAVFIKFNNNNLWHIQIVIKSLNS